MSDNSIVEDILKSRYYQPGETSWGQLCERVCDYMAPDDLDKFGKYVNAMCSKRFVPSSPVLFNAGTKCSALAACYGLGIEDNMDSIYTTLHRTAKIFKSGGGSGTNFSAIRPANSVVNGTNGVASGPISFMELFNSSSETIVQGGRRRGASIGILDISHPSIEEFVVCKNEEGTLSNFNISTMITDAFMEAVESNRDWDLVFEGKVYKTVKARDLYNTICKSIWTRAEPGLLFYDTINKDNTSSNPINTCNPCSELPLEVNPETLCGECCVLGSINLVAMLKDGKIDYNLLNETVRTAVDFLNDVIDKNEYPLPEIGEMTKANRRIGLGVMGFADVLIAYGLRYDNTSETIELINNIMFTVKDAADRRSEELGAICGGYPNQKVGNKQIRNATRLALAPTGTISLIAGVSSGIEPNFSYVYDRKNSLGSYYQVHEQFAKDLNHAAVDHSHTIENCELLYESVIKHMHEKGTIQDIYWLPDEFKNKYVTATDVSPDAHIAIQAQFQKYVDSSISKTINCPESTTVEEIEGYIMSAWKQGLKGLTFYRQNSRDDVVLNLKKETVPTPTPKTDTILDEYDGLVYRYSQESGMGATKKRPEWLPGRTYEAKSGCGDLYITVNTKDGAPYEVFVKTGEKGGCEANINAIGRLISIALRNGVPPCVITKQLGRVCCPVALKNGCSYKGKSCPDIIGKVLGLCGNPEPTIQATLEEIPQKSKEKVNNVTQPIGDWKQGTCPSCGSNVERSEGCLVCRNCGDSKC